MVVPGVAVTVDPFVLLKLPPGDQVYVLAPLAVTVELFEEQIEFELGDNVSVGNGFTFIETVTVAALEHEPVVPVTVYIVDVVGVETGFWHAVQLKPAPVVHV